MSAHLLRTARAFAPFPIDGQPCAVPVAEMALLARLGSWCGGNLVTVRGRGGVDVATAPPLPDGFALVRERHGAWRIDVTAALPAATTALGDVVGRLLAPAVGCELELVVGTSEDPDDPGFDDAGWHRYQGTVTGGAWHVVASYPPIDGETLADMLALARANNEATFRARYAGVWPMAGVEADEEDEDDEELPDGDDDEE